MENLSKYESVNKTAGTRYDENTRNLYILSPIQVVESMYLDTFYFLD